MPDGMGGGGEGAGGGSQGMGGGGNSSGGGGGYAATGGDARSGMGFAGTGSGLAGSGVGAASTGMGGGQMGANAGSPAAPTFSPQALALAKLAGLIPGMAGIAGIANLGMSAVNAFGGTSSSGTTGGGMGDSTGFGGGGDIGNALAIAGSINALTDSGGGSSNPGDPFGQYRANLAAQYAGALAPGGATNIEAMPGYTQFKTGILDPAMQASQRTAAATGQLYSGGESAALQKIGQQGYSAFMNDYLNRLSTGSGASNNPLGGAQLADSMRNTQQQSFMQGLGALGQGVSGISGLFGNATPIDSMAGFSDNYSTPSWYGSSSYSTQPMTSMLGNDWGASAPGIGDLFTLSP